MNKKVDKRIFCSIKEDKLINIKHKYFKLDFFKLLFLLLSKTILIFKSIYNRFFF